MAGLVEKVMKAVRVLKFGGPEVLSIVTDVPIPVPKDNEVLFKIKAAGVNPVDTYIRQGAYAIKPELPYTPGKDAAGIVEAVGKNVTRFKPGDRIFSCFSTRTGTYAEYASADSNFVFPLDSNLSFSQGSALGVPYFTAHRALIFKGKLKRKDTILVHGASGGVGIACIQLAKYLDCTVIGTAGTKEGMDLVRKVGADYSVCHRDENYQSSILEKTNGLGVDFIVEMLADVNLEKDMSMLKYEGKIAVVGSRGSVNVTPRLLMQKESSVFGVSLNSSTLDQIQEAWLFVDELIKNKAISPVVHKEINLDDAATAHKEIILNSGAKGKLILIP